MPLRILVPLERLEANEPALLAARQFFPEARLHLLHVVLAGELPRRGEAFLSRSGRDEEFQANRDAQSALEQLGEGEVVQMGDPATEILERAQSGEFDLIVLAPSGRSGLQRLLLGSVAERVIREAPIPVMSVRQMREARRA